MRWRVKQPAEILIIPIGYTGRIPAGSTLVSGIVSAINKATGLDATGTVVLSTTAVVNAGAEIVSFVSVAGVANTDYKYTVRVSLSNGMTVEDDIHILVREL